MIILLLTSHETGRFFSHLDHISQHSGLGEGAVHDTCPSGCALEGRGRQVGVGWWGRVVGTGLGHFVVQVVVLSSLNKTPSIEFVGKNKTVNNIEMQTAMKSINCQKLAIKLAIFAAEK